MESRSLFDTEDETIKRVEKIVDSEQFKNTPLYGEYKELSGKYKKLAKQFSRIVKISDKTQEQLRQSKESIQHFNKALKQANAEKDKFFSIIAHDLKNPFHGLLNLNSILESKIEKYSKAQILDLVSTVNYTAKNLYKLLENLLDWSRIQRGVMEFDPQKSLLSKIVQGNIELLSLNAVEKQIHLSHEVSDDLFVLADLNMLNMVFRNLISNAVKFTEIGGKIGVTAKSTGKQIEVSITDNGVGISEEDCLKLFRIDVTHSTTGTADESGTGLGLILCKEMIEKHSGRIWVESQSGEGTTFLFTLTKL